MAGLVPAIHAFNSGKEKASHGGLRDAPRIAFDSPPLGRRVDGRDKPGHDGFGGGQEAKKLGNKNWLLGPS